ncbi:hypothetical protein AB0L00_45785, partial [Actinoallomurus sp. NPDC052308]|uniref:hypothetical protein n=1 Tax=Actinoallomurus sp. NPDC052308 TaxID=3155530 RepID=UPI00341C2E3C
HPLNAPDRPGPAADNPKASEVVGRADDVPTHAAPPSPGEDTGTASDWSHRVLETMRSLAGSFRWGRSWPDEGDGFNISVRPSDGRVNGFAVWIRGLGPAPKPTDAMNCWEAILYAGYLSGALEKEWLVSAHDEATRAANIRFHRAIAAGHTRDRAKDRAETAYYRELLRRATRGTPTRHRIENGLVTPDVPAGHLVILGGDWHTVLALGTRDHFGRQEVMSHWTHPSKGADGLGTVQRTTLEELLQKLPEGMTIDSLEPVWSEPDGRSPASERLSAPKAPMDLRPASSVPAADVYAFDPARVRDWNHRALLAGRRSIDFFTWVPSGPDPNDDFRIDVPTDRGANDFARWLRGEGPAPSWLSAMNCWEFPLFTAYWVGAVDKAWLESIHDQAAREAKAMFDGLVAGGSDERAAAYKAHDVYMETLLVSITVGEVTEHRLDPRTGLLTPEVPAGHLVFIDGNGHVAWALGTRDAQRRQEVLSHWAYPSASSPLPFRRQIFGSRRTGYTQKTTIEELLPGFRPFVTVASAAPAWSDSRTVAASAQDPRSQAAPVPVVVPGKRVDPPASEDWFNRRSGAPVVRVATERFDPRIDFLPGRAPGRALGSDQAAPGREWRRFVSSLPGRSSRSGKTIQGREWRRLSEGLPGTARASGWETLVRANVQRIQAGNGRWVRRHVIALP